MLFHAMQIEDYLRRWDEKPALRAIYRDIYRRMARASVPGPGLEIGGGIGNLKVGNDLVRMDIQCSPGVNVAADAHRLPFRDGEFANVYLFDVLHHLECPLMFLAEAHRVLRPGGRVVLVEPGITPVSWLLYGMGHEEPVDMSWQPRTDCMPNPDKDPYASNQAIPTLLFKRHPEFLTGGGVPLAVVDVRWLSLFAYPLSGGFKAWSLIPASWVEPMLKFEDWLLPILGPFMAFRLMAVLEKR